MLQLCNDLEAPDAIVVQKAVSSTFSFGLCLRLRAAHTPKRRTYLVVQNRATPDQYLTGISLVLITTILLILLALC